MKKRIEEFTAEELGDVFWGNKGHSVNDLQPVLDYIKANLDTGFVPDWSRAPEWATSIVMVWSRQDEPWGVGPTEFNRITRPAPKMRHKTRDEKIEELSQWIDWGYEVDSTFNGREAALAECSDATLHDLCRAANIPLETEE